MKKKKSMFQIRRTQYNFHLIPDYTPGLWEQLAAPQIGASSRR